jgi:nitroreductase
MDLIEAIYGRRAVRSYINKDVPLGAIRGLIEAAIQAPSALNLQPWAFVLVQGRKRLADYSERAKLHFLEHFCPGSDPRGQMREKLTEAGFNIFYDAGTLIVVYAKPNGGQFGLGDCYLAAQNLMLAAHAAGLATCPIGFAQPWLDTDEVKSDLGVPSQYTAVIPLVLGYPAENPEKPERAQPEIYDGK